MPETFHVRASGFSELFDCPARWYARNILKLFQPASGRGHLGTAVHKATAAFDQQVILKDPITPSDACSVFVDTLHQPEEEVVWSDISTKEAEAIGLNLTVDYCVDIAPTKTYEAVELECETLEVAFPEQDVVIALTGHVDRIRVEDGKRGVSDLKTGVGVVDADGDAVISPHIVQLATYELLEILAATTTGKVLELPAEIIALPTSAGRSPAIGSVNRPSDILMGKDGRMGLLEMAATILKNNCFYGNTRSMLCTEKYCPAYNQCHWRGIT